MRYSLFAPRSCKGRSTSPARWRRTWTRWPGVQAVGLAARSVNILFQVCLPHASARLSRAPSLTRPHVMGEGRVGDDEPS